MVTTAERAASASGAAPAPTEPSNSGSSGGSGSSPAGANGKPGPYKARRGVVDPAAEALRALRALLKDKAVGPLQAPANTAAATALLLQSLTPLLTAAAGGGAAAVGMRMERCRGAMELLVLWTARDGVRLPTEQRTALLDALVALLNSLHDGSQVLIRLVGFEGTREQADV
jgi:hypothetical protein